MMKRTCVALITLAAALAATACGFEHRKNVLAPSNVAATAPAAAPAPTSSSQSLVGVWASQAVTPPSPSSCTNFKWRVTNQTATSLQGEFTADCAAGLTVSGTASGQLVNGTVPITVNGTASMPGIPNCSFSLSGTGTIQDNNNALYVPYTGTTCLGPVKGTEVLRRHVDAPAPPPAPAPTPAPPAPAPAPGPTSNDAMDIGQAIVFNSPKDIANWQVTTTIRQLDLGTGGVFIDFDKKSSWPEVTPPGWDGPLQYTLWIVINVNGRWHTSGCIEYWKGLDRNGGPPAQYAMNWYYDPIRWGAMSGHQPVPGEMVGFFVSAGDARNNGPISVKERSNVVMVPFPGSGGGVFGF